MEGNGEQPTAPAAPPQDMQAQMNAQLAQAITQLSTVSANQERLLSRLLGKGAGRGGSPGRRRSGGRGRGDGDEEEELEEAEDFESAEGGEGPMLGPPLGQTRLKPAAPDKLLGSSPEALETWLRDLADWEQLHSTMDRTQRPAALLGS